MIKTYKPNDTARIEAMLFTESSVVEARDWAGDVLSFRPTTGRVKTLVVNSTLVTQTYLKTAGLKPIEKED